MVTLLMGVLLKNRDWRQASAALTVLMVIAWPGLAQAADEDSAIARNLYTKPLTHRDTPPGYRSKPLQYTAEPRGFRDNPLNWTLQPNGFREKPITELDEPRNGRENPYNFVTRDGITVANLDESLKTPRDQHIVANSDEDLRIPSPGLEESALNGSVKPRNPGYKGINPPSKARLQNFQ